MSGVDALEKGVKELKVTKGKGKGKVRTPSKESQHGGDDMGTKGKGKGKARTPSKAEPSKESQHGGDDMGAGLSAKLAKDRKIRRKSGTVEFLCSFKALESNGGNDRVTRICTQLQKLKQPNSKSDACHCEKQHAVHISAADATAAEKVGGSAKAHPVWLEFWKAQADEADCVLLFDSHCQVNAHSGTGYFDSSNCHKEHNYAVLKSAKKAASYRQERYIQVGKMMDQGCDVKGCPCKIKKGEKLVKKTKGEGPGVARYPGNNWKDPAGTKYKRLTSEEIAARIWEKFQDLTADLEANAKAAKAKAKAKTPEKAAAGEKKAAK